MITAQGGLGTVHVIRLEPGEDIYDSIVLYCARQGILRGLVLGMHGSVDGAAFADVVPRPDLKAQFGYGQPTFLTDKTELVGGSGIISNNGGAPAVHIHSVFATPDGMAHGGHMISGNKVLLTVEISLAEVEGIELTGRYDDVRDGTYLHPAQMDACAGHMPA